MSTKTGGSDPSGESSSRESKTKRLPRKSSRSRIAVALMLLIAGVLGALWQKPSEETAKNFQQWLLYPREDNGFQRKAYFPSDFATTWGATPTEAANLVIGKSGNREWTLREAWPSLYYKSPSFAENGIGWAIDGLNRIVVTKDAGGTWQPLANQPMADSNDVNHLYAVAFATPERGWAVGSGGAIYATNDAGASWTKQNSPTQEDLYFVSFADEQHLWASGHPQGGLLRSSDGGTTWTIQSVKTKSGVRSIIFNSASTGYFTGLDGSIHRTTNGGVDWTEVYSGSDSEKSLYYVYFPDPSHGWAVGKTGTILATVDGGTNWKPQPSPTHETLLGVGFMDAKVGCAIGEDGGIIATEDGGEHWRLLSRPRFAQADFVGSSGWMAGTGGAIYYSGDGGQTWRPQYSGTLESLCGICFVDNKHGWALSKGGQLLATTNGSTWKELSPDSFQPFRNTKSFMGIQFADPTHGFVWGEDFFFQSIDGGTTWIPIECPQGNVPGSKNAVFFVNEKTGWAIHSSDIFWSIQGDVVTLYYPKPEGAADSRQEKAQRYPFTHDLDTLRSARFSSQGVDVIVEPGALVRASLPTLSKISFASLSGSETSMGRVSRDFMPRFAASNPDIPTSPQGAAPSDSKPSEDPKALPVPATVPAAVRLNACHFVNQLTGWAVGEQGAIVMTSDGGKTWTPQNSTTTSSLIAVCFTDLKRGWAVGMDGTVLATKDGGATWSGQALPSHDAFTGVHFQSELLGTITSESGNTYATQDAGKTWRIINSTYAQGPAPWFYAFLIISALLVVVPRIVDRVKNFIVTPPPPPPPDGSDVALDSDIPITKSSHDRLGFESFINVLRGFLANENTRPPLVLAITGQWGSGKTSIMNRLYNKLDPQTFTRVWFNAWHSDENTSMLTDILENIRQQGLPTFQNLQGLRLRTRLAWIRIRRSKYGRLILIPLISFSVSVIYLLGSERRADLEASIRYFAENMVKSAEDWNILKIVSSFATTLFFEIPRQKSGGAAFILFLSAIILLSVIVKWGNVYNVNPLYQFLASLSAWFRMVDLKSRSGFRQQFITTMSELTQSLAPRRLCLFIDDLDRCNAKQIRETLETVNYLTTSCECLVVIGMDWNRIKSKLATELDLAGNAELKGEKAHEDLTERYLRKIVNLAVRVPSPDVEVLSKLCGPREKDPSPRKEAGVVSLLWDRCVRVIRAVNRDLLAWAASALIVGVVWTHWSSVEPYMAGSTSQQRSETVETVKILPETSTVSPPSEAPKMETLVIPSPNPESRPVVSPIPYLSATPTPRVQGFRTLMMVLGVLFLVAFWWFTFSRSADDVLTPLEKDPVIFSQALSKWYPVVHEEDPTPRANKRYQNCSRFYAMMLKPSEAMEENKKVPDPLLWDPEPVVALTALKIRLDDDWVKLFDKNIASADKADLIQRAKLSKAQEAYLKKKANDFEEYSEKFKNIAAELF